MYTQDYEENEGVQAYQARALKQAQFFPPDYVTDGPRIKQTSTQ
jgi:hypothetical protein